MLVRDRLRAVFWKYFSKVRDCVNLRIHLMCWGFTETAFVSRIKWHIETFHEDV
jgi:hypothetical protein